VDAEAELAVVIGRDARNVPAARADEFIAGYTCANDVSARDWQFAKGGGQFCRGKMFATFCPLGPVMVSPDEFGPVSGRRLRGLHNGQVVQDSGLDDLIFSVPELIEFLSASAILPVGTVILTGTPSGVGFAATPPRLLQPGDVTITAIDGIGRLENPVVGEP
jgi:2-keto-4-pentenoate hydratase/2-oxohepta-3-ene-1,7-dioic acid hydratase in catechol pathway